MKTSSPITLDALRYQYHPANLALALDNGLTITVRTERHEDHGAPWKECDGHGPVSEWTTRDKHSGERVLCSNGQSKRYYDYAGAIRLAKKDGWDAPPYKTGTKGEQAVRAVERDFEFLRSWVNDGWEYIGVIVTLQNADGEDIAQESLWGIESCENPGHGYYWREVAMELANGLIEAHEIEVAERAFWASRDLVTV